jgi:hypothetical protein
VRRSYRVGKTSFGVRTTSEEFGAWLDETLAVYARRRRERPEFSVVLDGGGNGDGNGDGRRGRRFHILYRGIGAVVRTFDLTTLGAALFAELESRLLRDRDDAVYAFAALVRIDHVNVLVPSWFVSYLSRLGRKVERAGVTLPLATWVAVDAASGEVVRPNLTLDVPDDALHALGRMDGSDARIPALGPEAPVRVHAVLTYDAAIGGIDHGKRAISLYRLGGFTPNLERLGGDGLGSLRTLVEGARTFEIGLGRPQQMLDALLAVADHERSHR